MVGFCNNIEKWIITFSKIVGFHCSFVVGLGYRHYKDLGGRGFKMAVELLINDCSGNCPCAPLIQLGISLIDRL